MAKSPEAFRTISEAAAELGVAQHVLRFWETKFSFVRPMTRAGGRRFYRPTDIAVLAAIRRLLYDEGYTIKGVQKLHRDNGLTLPLRTPVPRAALRPALPVAALEPAAPMASGARQRIEAALASIVTAKARLDSLTDDNETASFAIAPGAPPSL